MLHRIEVAFRQHITDALGDSIKTRITDYLGLATDSVKTVDVYTIERELSQAQLDFLGKELFADPITQVYSIDRPIAAEFDWMVEIGFKPGVTDSDIEDLERSLHELPTAIPEILEYQFGRDVVRSERSYDFALVSSFADLEAMKTYQKHPDHLVVLQKVNNLCESVLAVDFYTDNPS